MVMSSNLLVQVITYPLLILTMGNLYNIEELNWYITKMCWFSQSFHHIRSSQFKKLWTGANQDLGFKFDSQPKLLYTLLLYYILYIVKMYPYIIKLHININCTSQTAICFRLRVESTWFSKRNFSYNTY